MDEIQAHTGIFDGKTNDGYYELGLITSQLIRDTVVSIRTRAEEIGDEGQGIPPNSPTIGATPSSDESVVHREEVLPPRTLEPENVKATS